MSPMPDPAAAHHPWGPGVSALEIIETGTRLAEVAGAISRQPVVGIDLEGNGRHRYPEHVCLLQMSIPGAVFIVDTLSVGDMSPAGRMLGDASIVKIIHSADFDLRCLDRDWGFHVTNLFDPAIAAAFLGLTQLGLAHVLSAVLGIEIEKSARLQKSDWTKRPLSQEALSYAAADVAHLHELRDAMATKLHALGRSGWVAEECSRLTQVRYEAPDTETAFLRIRGSQSLDPSGLAILRELAALRERHALLRGRPHFRVLSNETLVSLASEPRADLRKMRGLGPFGRKPLVGELRDALRKGLSSPPYHRPRGPRIPRLDSAAKKRLVALRTWRQGIGADLSITPSLVWPSASLERLARHPESAVAEFTHPEVRRWQAAEFGHSLEETAGSLVTTKV